MTPLSVPSDGEIEAAARAIFERSWPGCNWDAADEGERNDYRREIVPVVAAVLPLFEARVPERWEAEHGAEVVERLRSAAERLLADAEDVPTVSMRHVARILRAALTPDAES